MRGHAFFAACAGLAALIAAPSLAASQDEETPPPGQTRKLGSYEQRAVNKAMDDLGLVPEKNPEGKVLRRIHVVNLPVFGSDAGFLPWFNVFHRTTRDFIIEREVLLRPGQKWETSVVSDSERRLRDALFSTLAVIVAVQAPGENEVDLLAVTRDIWSLRLNSSFELQSGSLSAVSLSLAENNLFGWRKHASFVFDMDQGKFSLGPQYIDRNIAGTRLRFQARLAAIFARDSRDFEGTFSRAVFSLPLYSLRRKWGASLTIGHFDSRVRVFVGTELDTYDNPNTLEIEAVPWQYDFRTFDLESVVTRSFGSDVIQRVTFAHDLGIRRPTLVDGFPNGGAVINDRLELAALKEAFIRDRFPRSERSSALVASYRLFTPKFIIYRDLDSFDLPEDRRLGPEVSASAGIATKLLGSENTFVPLSLGAAWVVDIARDGFFRISAGARVRWQDGEAIDQRYSGTIKVATPRLFNAVRFVAEFSAAGLFDVVDRSLFVTIGGDNGLRGFPINAFIGDARIRANAEIRTMPIRILFTRLGGLVFWDVGHVADSFDEIDLQHDVGFGLRLLVPQAQPFVFRFDYAFPLTGVSAGLPGRLTAGVSQIF